MPASEAETQESSFSVYITDLKTIEKNSDRDYEANQKFSQFLKSQDPERIDALVQDISKQVSKGIDCQSCANCCKSLTVAINYQDITRLAQHCSLQNNDFKKKYLRRDHEGDMVFHQRPCPFLKKNSCSAYDSRPGVCRNYPYLDKGGFINRLGNVLSNLKVCPIAYNTFDLLKLHFE